MIQPDTHADDGEATVPRHTRKHRLNPTPNQMMAER
jgi:hypothetical protein